jgi:chaperonin cofactor prefoldin
MMDAPTGISTGTLITIILSSVGAFTGIILLLGRLLVRSINSATADKLKFFKETVDTQIDELRRSRNECEIRHTQNLKDVRQQFDNLVGSFESLKERWEKVLEKNTILEATQAEKVKSLFRSFDDMHDSIKDLKRALQHKMEDMMRDAKSDIRREMRELLAKNGVSRGT